MLQPPCTYLQNLPARRRVHTLMRKSVVVRTPSDDSKHHFDFHLLPRHSVSQPSAKFLLLILQSLKGTLVQTVGPHTVCIPGGRNGNLLQYSCLEKSHGQRSLAGYSSWGHKESDMTEHMLARTRYIRVRRPKTRFSRDSTTSQLDDPKKISQSL